MRIDVYELYRGIAEKRPARIAIALTLIAAGVLLPMALVPFEDFRFGDEPYQAYCCKYYERGYLGMLSFWIGHLWMAAFGERYISLRVLMTLCYVSSIAIGCGYLRHRGFSIVKCSAIFFTGAIGIILNNITVYGWDAGSYPFVALTLYSTLLYLEKPSWQRAAVTGAGLAAMTLARLPLITGVPVVAALILYRRGIGKDHLRIAAIDLASAAGGFLLTFIALTTLMVGSPLGYFGAVTQENTVGGHSISYLMLIWEMCVKFAYYISATFLPGCAAVALSYYYARQKGNSLWLHIAVIAIMIYAVRCAFMNMPNARDQLFWCNFGIIVPSAFFVLVAGPLGNLRSGKPLKPGLLYLAAIAGFAMTQAAGSDRIVERIGWTLTFAFAFGASSDYFLRERRLTFYLTLFTALVVTGFYTQKLNALNKAWLPAVHPRYATVFDGIRPYDEPGIVYAPLDSVKFLKNNLENLGLRTVAIGIISPCYNFSIDEHGENSGMKFLLTGEDVRNDFHRAESREPVDAVIHLAVWEDPDVDSLMTANRFLRYSATDFPRVVVYAKDSILPTLPADPYKAWGYRK